MAAEKFLEFYLHTFTLDTWCTKEKYRVAVVLTQKTEKWAEQAVQTGRAHLAHYSISCVELFAATLYVHVLNYVLNRRQNPCLV